MRHIISAMEDEPRFIDTDKQRKKRVIIALIAVVTIVVIAVVSAVLVKKFVIATFIVQGSSMYPTLDGGGAAEDDGDVLLLNRLADPERGDIIVFTYNWDPDPDKPPKALVKRVIGLPGDRVVIENNVLYVNGNKVDEPYINGEMHTPDIDITVRQGHYFVLGDNRDDSTDSRRIGQVPADTVIGRCFLIVGTDNRLRFPDK